MVLYAFRYSDGRLFILDQTKLPEKAQYMEITGAAQTAEAIKSMRVRGAPAIGICAAYGLCAEARKNGGDREKLIIAAQGLKGVRPTAKNLSWAVGRMLGALDMPGSLIENLEREAEAIRREDEEANRKIGENLLSLLPENGAIMTYCNAGALATSKYGTALSPVYLGLERGRRFKVYACETRPFLQGARITAYELNAAGADVIVICDNNAANVLRYEKIDAVITGCDRVAANGDCVNKVGTFGLSVLAKEFGIPFYVAAPASSIDMSAGCGGEIEIEMRGSEEMEFFCGRRIVPEGVKVLNPAFDMTPAENITAIVTESGAVSPKRLKSCV